MSAEEIAENLYKGDGPFRIIKHIACPVLVERHDRSLRMRLTEMRYRCDFDTLERRAEHIRRPDIVKKFQEVASIMEADGCQKFSGRKVARESEIYNKLRQQRGQKSVQDHFSRGGVGSSTPAD
ncbi:hypothetical protein [Salipiger sp. CCB-MM3]|uniref:hypothetical protein n=1 Tax=Salipiger sp. CCB-MM3 TaxID=1792508 RepID=UPI0012F82840|nr:hypothetical protein [Salipiger sp. CCB-MM3]